MIRKISLVLITMYCFLGSSSMKLAKAENKNDKIENNYLLETGEGDYRRMRILNEILNPYSIEFIKRHIKKDDKVLDVGCGIGLMTQEISKIAGDKGRITGIDLNNDKLVIAKKLITGSKNQIQFLQKSIYDLESLPKKYDVIYIRLLLVHLPDVLKVVDQIKKVLQPNGILLVEEIVGNDTIMAMPMDARLFDVRKVDDIQEEMQGSNFAMGANLKSLLHKMNFQCLSDQIVHPELNTTTKREIFSLGMKSLEKSMIKNKFTPDQYSLMINNVKTMEQDQNIKLFFYKIAQQVFQL